MLPDVVGLLGFGHGPEGVVGEFGGGDDAVDFGYKVVIGKEFVDAPEVEAIGVGGAVSAGVGGAEGRWVEVGVHVDDGLVGDDLVDALVEIGVGHGVVFERFFGLESSRNLAKGGRGRRSNVTDGPWNALGCARASLLHSLARSFAGLAAGPVEGGEGEG